MTKTIKRTLLLLLTLAFMVSSICIFASSRNAYATQSVEVTLTMEVGASVRMDGNGIRYGMYMSDTDYGTINKKVTDGEISNVVYGILIAPAYYHEEYALNEENVFGANAKYNWSVNGSYTSENGKVRITNLYSSELGEHKERDGYMVMYASIIDLKEENIDKEFIGVGYMKYTVGTTDKYIFAPINDNVRSMAYVAQTYIEKYPNDIDRNELLQKNYLEKVAFVASNYTTEYYLETANGDFVKDSKSVVTASTIGAKVMPIQKEIDGYYFDSSNENNSGESTVYANDKTVLKLYYKLAKLNADGTFFNSDFDLSEKLASSPCATPVGWAYDGDNAGWNYMFEGGKLRLNGYDKRVESIKLPFEAGNAVSASVDGYVNEGNSYFNIFIYFYNSNGERIQTNSLVGSASAITNTTSKTYTTAIYVSPANTAYVAMGITHGGEGNVLMYVDNAKLNVYENNGKLNADGTFFNSDFSIVEKPSAEVSPCALPYNWTCTDIGNNAGWNYYAVGGEVRFNGWGKSITSAKFDVTAGDFITASVDARKEGDNSAYFNMHIYFYDANGTHIETVSYGDTAMSTEKINYSKTVIVPANATQVALNIAIGTEGLGYADNVKILASDISPLNADGSFYNSDWKLGQDAPADGAGKKPVGWTWSHKTTEVEWMNAGYVQLWGGSVTSSKIKLTAGTKLNAEAIIANYDPVAGLTFNLILTFYNENDEEIETCATNGIAIAEGGKQTYSGTETTAPEGTAYVKYTIGSNKKGYLYAVKLNVVE